MKTLTVRLPDSLFAEIESAARIRNVSKSQIVRERLDNATATTPSLWSRMEHLVIDDESLPPDLSSKKKHLQYYGRKHPA